MLDLWAIKELIYGERWRSKPHMAECAICGEILHSKNDYYSPEECGWMKIIDSVWKTREHQWLCHRCHCHRDFKPFIEEVDRREKEKYK